MRPQHLWPIPAALLTLTLLHPACPIHTATGLLCPGCGSTRAFLSLLHGHPTAAFHQNPLFVLLLPIALAVTLRRRPIPPPALYLACTLTAAFTLFRNLP